MLMFFLGHFSVKSMGIHASVCDGGGWKVPGKHVVLGPSFPVSHEVRMFVREPERGISLQLKYEVKWRAIRPEESDISWKTTFCKKWVSLELTLGKEQDLKSREVESLAQ